MQNWKFNLYKLNNTLQLPAPKATKEELEAMREESLYKELRFASKRNLFRTMIQAYSSQIKDPKIVMKVINNINNEYWDSQGIIKLPMGSYFRYIHKKWLNKFIAEGALKECDGGTIQIKNYKKLIEINSEYNKWKITPQQILM